MNLVCGGIYAAMLETMAATEMSSILRLSLSATFQTNVASPPVPISIAYSKRKKALGISGVLANVYSWSCRPFVDATGAEWRGGQIDMLIDRADGAINICEMKYAKDEFVIDAGYEQRLQSIYY